MTKKGLKETFEERLATACAALIARGNEHEARANELEAQCAVMRGALQMVMSDSEICELHAITKDAVDDALKVDAGAALLARHAVDMGAIEVALRRIKETLMSAREAVKIVDTRLLEVTAERDAGAALLARHAEEVAGLRQRMADAPNPLVLKAVTAERDALRAMLHEGETRIAHLIAVRDPHPAIDTLAWNLTRVAAERDVLMAKVEGLMTALREAYRVHVDVECPSTPCTCLAFDTVRAALADTEPKVTL